MDWPGAFSLMWTMFKCVMLTFPLSLALFELLLQKKYYMFKNIFIGKDDYLVSAPSKPDTVVPSD